MKINATFSQIFAKIACAGEVVLHVDQYDYNLCAMHIKCVSTPLCCITSNFPYVREICSLYDIRDMDQGDQLTAQSISSAPSFAVLVRDDETPFKRA